ncbi:MAG: glutamate--tRNA ligase [Bacteriovoracales bacterium]
MVISFNENMSVRVRFAPSPTGYLHIGGARTALYCYLFAKAHQGKFVLRIEDTDLDRSKREFEESQIGDLKWLGLNFDEGPHAGGSFGPYRQSERLDIYKKYSLDLVDQGHAFKCFCTQEELDRKKALLSSEAPHYDGTCKRLSKKEVEEKISKGIEYAIRFSVPDKNYSFKDHVRGLVGWPKDMVGDFVILRSNGMPTYNFCCVIDDHLMKISHVIRAEEHLNNTLRQLMIYDALKADPPEFAHVSLLIGEDRQKLSKRHGATSVTQYKEMNYLPGALLNYLSLLGWSHPKEVEIFDIEEIIPLFNLDRFSKSPAIYDISKLNFINGQHIKRLSKEILLEEFNKAIPKSSLYHLQTNEWKEKFVELFRDKITFFNELEGKVQFIFSTEKSSDAEYIQIMDKDTTKVIKDFISQQILKLDGEVVPEQILDSWMNEIKESKGIKGKDLFMGLRAVLTGAVHGPDLKKLLALTPLEIVVKRVG